MENSVAIERVIISIGKKEIPLTLEEAKELMEILNNTFGKKEIVISPSPIIIERPYTYPHWTLTYSHIETNTAGMSTMYCAKNN